MPDNERIIQVRNTLTLNPEPRTPTPKATGRYPGWKDFSNLAQPKPGVGRDHVDPRPTKEIVNSVL